MSGVAGFRGAVSLAAALGVPRTIDSGAPFPGRDSIIFVTAGVIAVTLVQALALPPIARWARLPGDSADAEQRLAETRATERALDALPELAQAAGADDATLERVRSEYTGHLDLLHAQRDNQFSPSALRQEQRYAALRLAVIAHKRSTVLQLRDANDIDDTVLRRLQAMLDREEVRLRQQDAAPDQ